MKNIKGETYGKLLAISFEYRKGTKYYWKWKCTCGNEKTISISNVKHGNTKSCGCLQKRLMQLRGKKNKTHGESKTPFYRIWVGIKNRCQNKREPAYSNYGGRGITLCERWQNYLYFKKDMYEKYLLAKREMQRPTIDRIDNDEGYCKENCRWVNHRDQARNTRNNHLITYEGETRCLAEWAEIKNMKYDTLRNRIVLYGLSPREALELPHYYRK